MRKVSFALHDGFSEVLVTIMKLSVITVLTLLIQQGMEHFNRNRRNTYEVLLFPQARSSILCSHIVDFQKGIMN